MCVVRASNFAAAKLVIAYQLVDSLLSWIQSYF